MRLVHSTQEEFSLKRAHYGHSPLYLPIAAISASMASILIRSKISRRNFRVILNEVSFNVLYL